MPTLSDHDSHLYIRDDSGGLLVGCFEPMGKAIDPDSLGEGFDFGVLSEDWDHFEPMMINALHRLPALETAEVKMLLNGPESFTPDGVFLLGEAAETRGLFLGCGMNSVGVATGGGAGMALARNIIDGHMPFDLHEVDPKRFAGCWNDVAALSARVPEVLGKHYEITYPGRQWVTGRNLRRVPLDARWRQAGAHMGQFFGWERPLYFNRKSEPELTFGRPAWFDQVGREVMCAHKHAALFDQSTFGKILVSGPDAEQFLNRVCANNMSRLPGRAIYSAMLNERGGIESDITALRLTEDSYRLYVGTTAIKRDLTWLYRHMMDAERVTLTDETDTFAVIGLMGPEAAQIADKVGAGELNELAYFQHGETHIAGAHVRGVRMSYVGEAGWEITCRSENAEKIYDALYAEGARPAGVLAQSSMRIEKRFLAYGHDLDTDTDPMQAGLGFAIAWKTDFIGREALMIKRDQAPAIIMVSLLFDDGNVWPLGNEPVYLDGEIIGKTTSAAYGYRVGAAVALAYVSPVGDGTQVMVDIAGHMFGAKTSLSPVFDPTGNRMRTLG